MGLLRRYARWLHTGVPAGRVEALPALRSDGATDLRGLHVVGDLAGIPLLKFALDTGARAVRKSERTAAPGALDLVIVGAGVSGIAAAAAAKERGLRYLVVERADDPFPTVRDFPPRKPIFTYPTAFRPTGAVEVSATVREDLLAELHAAAGAVGDRIVVRAPVDAVRRRADGFEVVLSPDARPVAWTGTAMPPGWSQPLVAREVVLAVGRAGGSVRLGVPGEDLDFVRHRFLDPAPHAGRRVLVVGGGDTACEAATALADVGAKVVLAHRGPALVRPKAENVEALARRPVEVALRTEVVAFRAGAATLVSGGARRTLDVDDAFVLIGRKPPVELLERSGVRLRGRWSTGRGAALAAALLACAVLFAWKGGLLPSGLEWLGASDPRTLLGTVRAAARDPSFAYTLAYCALVVGFGVRRVRRQPTPYVKAQTLALAAVQVVLLFLLPQILLPWAGANAAIPSGVEAALFPNGEYWRAYGFVLAWPLFFWNLATAQPLTAWLWISLVQTFVLLPLLVWRFGKGAYCGWICSCGALAETLGDAHRDKMPHGPTSNRWNLAGQVLLGLSFAGLLWRAAGWVLPAGNAAATSFDRVFAPTWRFGVDFLLAGVLGLGAYFALSGRVWCRFLCPLAALLHVYAKFTRFRIFPEKARCISCNACTASCHQGVDVMAYAQRGTPMDDVQCVRCSACVSVCPTGALSFGRADAAGAPVALDRLGASPAQREEGVTPEATLARLRGTTHAP